MRTLTLHLFGDLCRSPMESRVPFRMAGLHAAGHDSDTEQPCKMQTDAVADATFHTYGV